MQNMYRITVERMNDAGDWCWRTEITFTTEYKIDTDLAEWVKTEIDTNATVTGQCGNCLDPDNGIHAIDCSLNPVNIATRQFQNQPTKLDVETICDACEHGDHESCSDEGLKRTPYWCQCAASRHSS